MGYSTSGERGEVASPRECTLASLASALRDIPHPDPEYRDDLTAIVSIQPAVPELDW